VLPIYEPSGCGGGQEAAQDSHATAFFLSALTAQELSVSSYPVAELDGVLPCSEPLLS